jgi:hypothetical protein
MNEISYSYVALIDVLAYREYLARDTNSGRLEFRDAMSRALSVFNNVNENDFPHTAISDTIIVTCSKQDQIIGFLRLLKRVQISFLRQGLFLRGATVYARHFQSGSLTYSPALTGAYKLEQDSAIYPRIMIDQNILEMFNSLKQQDKLITSGLVAEWNGVFFLNALGSQTWKVIYDAAKKLFRRDSRDLIGKESAFAKHVWFENFIFSSQYVKRGATRYIPKPKMYGKITKAIGKKQAPNKFIYYRSKNIFAPLDIEKTGAKGGVGFKIVDED